MSNVGIRHIHLLVAEHERAAAFYTEAFGMVEGLRTGPLVILATPGGGDTLSLHLAATEAQSVRASVSRVAMSTSAFVSGRALTSRSTKPSLVSSARAVD